MRIIGENARRDDGLRSLMERTASRDMREKPSFSETWLMPPGLGEEVESYRIPGARVSIRNSADGQIDYVLIPDEYRLDDRRSKRLRDAIAHISLRPPPPRTASDKSYVESLARESLTETGRFNAREAAMTMEDEDFICSMAVRYTSGYGLLETLLQDGRVEDVFIDAPCDRNRVHVTVNGISGFNSVVRCRTNLLLERLEMEHLVSRISRHSGLPFSEAHPILECDMGLLGTRATVVGMPLSPAGTALALRRRSQRPWTLPSLVRNGTMGPSTAALLSLMVDGGSTLLICGPKGSGKSSLLSACMFEFPLSQRILALEDTQELPVEAMQELGYKVQSILADDRNGRAVERSREALRLSLRMGEAALVMGEVRGEEAAMLYEAMRTGRSGSTVMGTIHGDSAASVYDRVVHDIGVSPEAFMATDAVVSLELIRPRGSQRMRRGVKDISETGLEPGEFEKLMTDGGWSDDLEESRTVRRIADSWGMTTKEVMSNLDSRRLILAHLQASQDERASSPRWAREVSEHVASAMASGPIDPSAVCDAFAVLYGRRSVGE